MKILHVVPTYLPAVRYGGPIFSVHGLCRALAVQGHDVHVFTTNVDGDSDSEVMLDQPVDLDGVQVWYFPCRRLRRLYYSPQMMTRLRQDVGRFDLLHLHSVFLWPTWAAARAARQSGVPYILSPRGMLVKELIRRKSRWLKTCWISLIEKKNIEQAAAIHVTSANEARELKKFSLQLSLVKQIANGVDTPSDWSMDALSRDVRAVTRKDGYVLFFGRLNWKKGIDRLLRAWEDVPDHQLVVAGNDEEGYCRELKNITREQGIEDRTVFLARSLTGADKEALFAGAGLFVLPSYSENFGITVLEAMIRGIPVVVTPEVGAADIVRQSGGGKVVPAENLGPVIARLLSDISALQAMGKAGTSYAADKYSWPRIALTMQEQYYRVVHA